MYHQREIYTYVSSLLATQLLLVTNIEKMATFKIMWIATLLNHINYCISVTNSAYSRITPMIHSDPVPIQYITATQVK